MLILANIWGWCLSHWRWFAYGAAALIVLFVLIFAYKGCSKKQTKLDEKAIVEAQQAIEKQDRAKMQEILAKSDADEAVADGIIANSKADVINKQQESREKYKEMTNDELARELEARK